LLIVIPLYFVAQSARNGEDFMKIQVFYYLICLSLAIYFTCSMFYVERREEKTCRVVGRSAEPDDDAPTNGDVERRLKSESVVRYELETQI
jgi:hypothetical protein